MADIGTASQLQALEVTPSNLAREYVAAPTGWSRIQPAVIPSHRDDLPSLPFETIRLMSYDPVVSANFDLLRELVLADGVQIVPHLDDEQDEAAADNKLAAEIAAFCSRVIEQHLETPFRETLEGLLEAIPYGHRIAEQTFKQVFEGTEANRIVTKSIKLKDHSAVNFVVDAFWNIIGIKPNHRAPSDVGDPPVLPRIKFVIFTYHKQNEDPRGQSGWRCIFAPWKFKQQVWPILERFLKQCAIPGLIGKVSPTSKPEIKKDGKGNIVTGNDGKPVTLSPTDVMLAALMNYENSTVIAVAAGSEVDQIQTQSEGKLFTEIIGLTNREITQGQLRSTRATTEAEHGSKADSETSLDLLTTFVWYLKGRLIDVIRNDVIKPLVWLNFGPLAMRLTPDVMLGDTDRFNWADDSVALSKIGPMLADSQWDALCQACGIEPPLLEENRPTRNQVSQRIN
ncbi:MAG: hypothetical protein MOB07_06650 [Acidobacteria bacterium]|nr:hypothetical protein [Acidobacteriota bacterium]